MIQHFCEIIGKAPLKQLVIILHGYGASGENIIGIADYWKSARPHTIFVAPNAPDFIPSVYGFQWFPIGDLSPTILKEGCTQALPTVVKFVQEAQQKYNLSWQQTVLVGFSQGAMLALYAALSTPHLCGKVISYSGGIYMEPHEVRTNPQDLEILLVHGTLDTVVPVQASHRAKTFLDKAGFRPSLHTIPGLDHTIDEEGLQEGLALLK